MMKMKPIVGGGHRLPKNTNMISIEVGHLRSLGIVSEMISEFYNPIPYYVLY